MSRKRKKLTISDSLRHKILSLSEKGFSPQQIATAIHKEDGVKLSRVAIYGFIKREHRSGHLVFFFFGGRKVVAQIASRYQIGRILANIPILGTLAPRMGTGNGYEIGNGTSWNRRSTVLRFSQYCRTTTPVWHPSQAVLQMVVAHCAGNYPSTARLSGSYFCDNGSEFAKHEAVNSVNFDFLQFNSIPSWLTNLDTEPRADGWVKLTKGEEYIIELICPWEENFAYARERKTNKYTKIYHSRKLEHPATFLLVFEIGARGKLHSSARALNSLFLRNDSLIRGMPAKYDPERTARKF